MLKVLGVTRRGVHSVLAAAGVTAAVIAGTAAPAAAAPPPGVFAWGNNEDGQLGDGTTVERDAPVPVTGLPAGVQQVTVSEPADFSAALLADGTVSAWGTNGFGQLGDDTTIGHLSPRPVVNLTGVTQISAGGGHMLAVGSGGAVWSWGRNESGQLGNGTAGNTTNTDFPAKIPGLTGIIQVAAGDSTSLALRSDGTVWAWGSNSTGQLGDHTTVNRDTPERVPGLTGITQIASGGAASFALRSDGTLFAWGDNGSSELGNGTVGSFSTAAAPVPGLTGVTQVSSSGLTTLAIAGASATAWAWGDGSAGQIGDGATGSHRSPKQLALTGVAQVSSGIFVSAAVLSDGTLLTWGDNGLGELGIGTNGGAIPLPRAGRQPGGREPGVDGQRVRPGHRPVRVRRRAGPQRRHHGRGGSGTGGGWLRARQREHGHRRQLRQHRDSAQPAPGRWHDAAGRVGSLGHDRTAAQARLPVTP